MKKNKIFNLIMTCAILIIIAGGVMLIGSLRGWFDEDAEGVPSPSSVSVRETSGIVNIERSGIGYYLQDGSKLREGDIVQTLSGSGVKLYFGEESFISLNEDTEITLAEISENKLAVTINKGEIFANSKADSGFTLEVTADNIRINASESTFSAVNLTGSQTVRVFRADAEVTAGEENRKVTSGNVFASVSHEGSEDELQISVMHQTGLNEFLLNSVTALNRTETLCFTSEQAQKVMTDRENEKAEAMRNSRAEDSRILDRGGNVKVSEDGTTQPADGKEKKYCTINIRCETILDNMKDLAKGKGKYVPANGVILSTSRIEFYEGETVFDVLKRACSRADIQIEYSWTPLYGSYYVEGLNHLYEFDCGGQSGWMYKVNGWYPNYGCSVYKLKDGDVISWNYTCKGLGGDLGAPMQ